MADAQNRRGNVHVGSFYERGGRTAIGNREQPLRMHVGLQKNIDFYVPDDNLDSETLGRVFFTLVDLALAEENECQMCAYIAAAMNIVIPMTNEWTIFFGDINCICVKVGVPSGMAGQDLSEGRDWWSTMSCLLQLVLLLYKNVADASYMNYMNNRVVAARAFLSAPEQQETEVVLTIEKAKIIRRILGGSHKLKSLVLQKLLSYRTHDNSFGQMCSYLCGILAWNEMSYLTFIVDELITPGSPILEAPEVAGEINNITRALTEVLVSPYPQYFKIMTPPSQQKHTERNKFPLLIAAAACIKTSKTKSVANYATGIPHDDPTVVRLVGLHMRRAPERSVMTTVALDWLKGNTTLMGGADGMMNPAWEA